MVTKCEFCNKEHDIDFACPEFKLAVRNLNQRKTLNKEESTKLRSTKR